MWRMFVKKTPTCHKGGSSLSNISYPGHTQLWGMPDLNPKWGRFSPNGTIWPSLGQNPDEDWTDVIDYHEKMYNIDKVKAQSFLYNLQARYIEQEVKNIDQQYY